MNGNSGGDNGEEAYRLTGAKEVWQSPNFEVLDLALHTAGGATPGLEGSGKLFAS